MAVSFHRIHEIPDQKIQYVVILSRYKDKWIFCRHRERSTWEIPGGKREAGESCLDAAKRELSEETGAHNSKLSSVCIYSVTQGQVTTYGTLYFALIEELKHIPAESEIAEITFWNSLPCNLTYPEIQPALFWHVQGWLNIQSNTEELWDVYDENRILTGQLHRRGDPMKTGEYHLVVHVWIFDSQGRFLLTKRSPNKGFPNMWESTGGSALAGEDSLNAAVREVKEETGLILDPKQGKHLLTVKKMDYFRDVWLFCQNFELSDVVLLPGETTDKMYASREELLYLQERGELVPYDYLGKLLELTNEQDSL